MEKLTVAELKQLPSSGKTPFHGIFVLRQKDTKTARNGSEFLAVELGDRTGSFRANCFQDTAIHATLQTLEPGCILEVQGDSDFFNNQFSPRLHQLTLIEEDAAVEKGLIDTLVKVSSEDPQALREEFQGMVDSLSHPELKATVQLAIQEAGEDFFTSSAAMSMHHAYRFGLLEHTVRMARCAQALLPLYPEVHADLALAGILLHDLGKTLEYTQGLATGKTRAGQLQGHVVLGYRMVRKAAIQSKLDPDLAERLEHIILSHQGEMEWGAAIKAATPEAVFVSMVDNLDARMGMVQDALRHALPSQEFSEFLPGLGANLLLTPPSE